MKKIISLVLSLVMLLSVTAGLSFTAKAAHYDNASVSSLQVGDTFNMGNWPQSRVTDAGTRLALSNISCTLKSYDYFSRAKWGTINMKYADIVYNGNLYRKVVIGEQRVSDYEGGADSGAFQEQNGYKADTYYFKWEPIKWVVVNVSSDNVYVMSQSILDSRVYHDQDDTSWIRVTWNNSDIRYWLGHTFYDSAFTATEKNKIIKEQISNPNNPHYNTKGGIDTNDSVFLISRSEWDSFKSNVENIGIYGDEKFAAKGTAYAKCQGLQVSVIDSAYTGTKYSGNSKWWMRSPGYGDSGEMSYYANYIEEYGIPSRYNEYYQDYGFMTHASQMGIRPCMKLKKTASITPADPPAGYVNINLKSNISGAGTMTGGGLYKEGSTITLKATSNTGYTFKEWSFNSTGGALSTNNPYTLPTNISGNYDIYAIFQKTKHTVIAAAAPNGDAGTVSVDGSSPASTASGTYEWGVSIQIKAAEKPGYKFIGWDGDKTTTSKTFYYKINKDDKSTLLFIAKFKPYNEDVTVKADGGGSVAIGSGEFSKEVKQSFEDGGSYTVKAKADEGYTFDGWYNSKGEKRSGNEGYSFDYDTADDATFIAKFNKKPEPTISSLTPSSGQKISEAQVDKFVTNLPNDNDAAGTKFSFMLGKQKKVTKNAISLTWKKPANAAYFVVYGNKCGAGNKYKKITKVWSTTFTQSGLAKNTYYKYMIAAFDKSGNLIGTTNTIHVATIGGKNGNAKAVSTKAKKNKVTLKKGKSFKLGAKQTVASKKQKIKKHRAIRYECSNTAVATVSAKGVIKGRKKGNCIVYAYAQNGAYKAIKVTVK